MQFGLSACGRIAGSFLFQMQSHERSKKDSMMLKLGSSGFVYLFLVFIICFKCYLLLESWFFFVSPTMSELLNICFYYRGTSEFR